MVNLTLLLDCLGTNYTCGVAVITTFDISVAAIQEMKIIMSICMYLIETTLIIITLYFVKVIRGSNVESAVCVRV